jgi:hypothetical protein
MRPTVNRTSVSGVAGSGPFVSIRVRGDAGRRRRLAVGREAGRDTDGEPESGSPCAGGVADVGLRLSFNVQTHSQVVA